LSRKNWFLFATGGVSYLNADETGMGGTYGLSGGLRVWRAWGLTAAFSANHMQGSDSVLGSVGLLKTPVFHPTNPYTRISLAFNFDQFGTNSPINLYLSQIRGEIAYNFNLFTAVGFRFAEPIHGDARGIFVDPVTLTSIGTLRTAQSYSGFVSAPVGDAKITAEAGTLVNPDAFFVGLDARVPLTDRVSAFANGSYDDRGLWAAVAGVQISLGGTRRRCQHAACCCPEFACASAAPDVVRGQGLEETGFFAGLREFSAEIGGLGNLSAASALFLQAALLPTSVLVEDDDWGEVAEIVEQRRQGDPNAFRRALPRFILNRGGGLLAVLDLKTAPCDQAVAALIKQFNLTPGQGLSAYLANPNFSALTQILFDNGRFSECCHELAKQLQLNAADTQTLCN
jgi:hypothetical protein